MADLEKMVEALNSAPDEVFGHDLTVFKKGIADAAKRIETLEEALSHFIPQKEAGQ